jgi:simple sugar transport system permease protein
VGENPQAADSLGIRVSLTRYVTTVAGSMLIGLAGAYLPMVYTGTFTDGIVRGRGWLAIALTFFGGWSPHLILAGAFFFAAVEVLAFRVQVSGVAVPYQLILMLPYLATMAVMMPTFRRLRVPAFLGRNYDRERRLPV